jgi:hypothetical protein
MQLPYEGIRLFIHGPCAMHRIRRIYGGTAEAFDRYSWRNIDWLSATGAGNQGDVGQPCISEPTTAKVRQLSV